MKLLTKSFLLLLALLIGAEVVVRTFWARNMSGRFEYGYHPTAGFVAKEGEVHLERAGGRRFHPQSFEMPKPEGTYRIFTIGGSVPRGPSLEKSYAHQLGEILDNRGMEVESFNLSVAGYGARRSQIVLKQALRYQPDLIILHVNDSNEYEDDREWRRKEEFASAHPKNWLMKSFLLRRLYELKTEKVFWKLLEHDIRLQTTMNDADAEIAAMNGAHTKKKWQKRVKKIALESVQMARQVDIDVLVLVQAIVYPDKEGKPFLDDKGLDEIREFFEEQGARTLSMREIFEEQKDFASDFSDGSHLRASGHWKIASELAEEIMKN